MLEIGSDIGLLVEGISINKIYAVDPIRQYRIPFKFRHVKFFEMSSDQFFEQNKEEFDLIYIDGLHTYEQSFKDLINSMDKLKTGGPSLIYLDDVLPNDEFSCLEDPFEAFEGRKRLHGHLNDLSWMGSVYKLIPLLVESEISYSTHNLDGKYVTRIKFDQNSNKEVEVLRDRLIIAKEKLNLKKYSFKDIKLENYRLVY